jgi:thiamine-monophosphate kinase
MKEFEFINMLKENCMCNHTSVGIGDDAALFGNLLIAKDIMCENIHFLSSTPAQHVVFKLFTANVSDIAAMGGRPKIVFLGLGLPPHRQKDKTTVIKAVKAAAEFYNLDVAGGDTSSSKNDFFLSLTIIGSKGKYFLLRNGAVPGDKLYLSRPLGLSRISLERELNAGFSIDPYYHYKISAEMYLGKALGETESITSCIDISDGLGRDAYHISMQSGVKIVINKHQLPLEHLKKYGVDEADYFINSGEEFALLFTASQKFNPQVFMNKYGTSIYHIGHVEEGLGVYLKDGKDYIDISNKGYEHE